jgi:DNA-binding response OmpR family regulator
MHPLPSILIYGRDACLLETRCWVLESAGFEVSTTLDLEEAAKRIEAARVDLFILCHTLSVEECASILATTHSLRPRMKTLMLSTYGSGCESKEDIVLGPFTSPQTLISTVCELMRAPFAPN